LVFGEITPLKQDFYKAEFSMMFILEINRQNILYGEVGIPDIG